MVGAKTRCHFGEVTKRSAEEYIIVQDTHEPIISRSDFQAVAGLMEQTGEFYKSLVGKPTDIEKPEKVFAGLIYCGHCHKPLGTSLAKRTFCYSAAYRCLECNEYSDKHIYISFKDINYAVLKTVQSHFATIVEYETKCKKVVNSTELQEKINNAKEDIKTLEQNSTEIKDKIVQLYIDFTDGFINEAVFKRKKDEYYKKQSELEKDVAQLNESISIYSEKTKKNITELGEKYYNLQTLNAGLANEIVESIEVFNNKIVEVHFKYDDEFKISKSLSETLKTEVCNA